MLKAALILMGVVMLAYAGWGIKKQVITCKGCTYFLKENPFMFWLSIAVIAAFGLMLIFFGVR